MWSDDHWKPTGDRQKDFYKTKAVRKMQMELGRNRREVIRSGLVPRGGDSEGEGDYTGRHGQRSSLGSEGTE